MLQKNWPSLKKTINNWIKKEKVVDVILFGSTVRGKTHPNDLDLCIIIPDNYERKSLDLVHSLAQILGKGFQINILTQRAFTFGEDSLAKTILQEGVSIVHSKKMAELWGLNAESLFIYTLTGFSSSNRVRFHYLLRGRKTIGMLQKLGGNLIKDGVISIPTEHEDEFKEILSAWRITFEIKRSLC